MRSAEFLVKERAVGALGVDTASIDHGPSQDFPVHRIVGGGSGGPLRVVALVAN